MSTSQEELRKAAAEVVVTRAAVFEAALDLCRVDVALFKDTLPKFVNVDDLAKFRDLTTTFERADQDWTEASNILLELVGGKRS